MRAGKPLLQNIFVQRVRLRSRLPFNPSHLHGALAGCGPLAVRRLLARRALLDIAAALLLRPARPAAAEKPSRIRHPVRGLIALEIPRGRLVHIDAVLAGLLAPLVPANTKTMLPPVQPQSVVIRRSNPSVGQRLKKSPLHIVIIEIRYLASPRLQTKTKPIARYPAPRRPSSAARAYASRPFQAEPSRQSPLHNACLSRQKTQPEP